MAGDLPSASSLLSSRWSRDNLVTSHPFRLYNGRVVEPIEAASIDVLLDDLREQRGPCLVAWGHRGVFTWDIHCVNDDGPFVLQLPLALDEPGMRDRRRSDVPRQNAQNMGHFLERGLGRYVAKPEGLFTLGGNVVAAVFEAPAEHDPILFSGGSIQVELVESNKSWLLGLGPAATAEILAEIVAAVAYHYDAETDGGTTIADVYVNDGDFWIKRRGDGSFELRLGAIRKLETGVSPDLLLLYLCQLMAYEDWNVDRDLTGLPVLISNPSVAFEGLVRGRRYRHADLGGNPDEGEREARRFIEQFGKSREGRAYRPWVERFLKNQLPLAFGNDLRERWWRLEPLERKLGLRELEARTRDDPDEKASVRALSAFLKRLTQEVGRTQDDQPGVIRINDLGLDELLALLEQAEVNEDARDEVASEIFLHWPHRTLDQLIARVPGARALRRMKSRIFFGTAIPEEEQFTLKSLGPPPKEVRRVRTEVPSDVLSSIHIPPALHQEAIRTFPSFETYMDDALHHPAWGYYARSVVIASGSEGHFNTHPEELSPRYGAWVARRAFAAYQEMLAAGELGASDRFFVIEFGAGNGRLARDVVDEVDSAASRDDSWRTFASRLEYRIYERSQSLREKQKSLLGERATVGEGDARHPAATLKRDFPDGLRGFVVTNEVPDAFGVHKVLVSREGQARAALVVPRVERGLVEVLPAQLRQRTADTNANLRKSFHLQENEGDEYLDRETYAEVMQAIATHADREALLARLWFEETYVGASLIPELRAHLRDNARDYAVALAAEDSGVVLYPNLHADRFISELGSSLAAGLVLTIDYGDSAWGLIQGARRGHSLFRIYGEWKEYVPRPNDPYALPGTQDLTADVNFSALSRAGEQAGMTFVHYGPERDIVGKDLLSLIRASAQEPAVAKFLGSPGFTCLVLGTRQSNAFSAELATPLSLASPEQEVPKSRRERIAKLIEILSAQ